MQIDIKKIKIPANKDTPSICLRVRVVYKNQNALKTAPYMFILPGGPGSNHSYYLNYDCLAEVVNLIYYDPRGCGLSGSGDSSTYTMDNYINDLHIIKESLELDSVILLGKSYGAMCALGYALRFPKDVNKLILAAGVPACDFIKTAQTNLKMRGTKEQQQICQNIWSGSIQNDEEMSEYFKIMATMYSWRKRNQQIVNRLAPTHRFTYEALNEGFATQFGHFDYRNQLKNLLCQTLILVGEEDWITDPMYSKEMAEKISNSTLHIFPNSDHAMESDVPELYFNTIVNFLK